MGFALLAVLIQCRKQEESPALKPPGIQVHRANPEGVAPIVAPAEAAAAAEGDHVRSPEEYKSPEEYVEAAAKATAALEALNAFAAPDTLGYERFRDSVTAALGSLPTLETIHLAASLHIELKDSIERVIGSGEITDPKDSAAFAPSLEKGFRMMMAYRRLLAYGIPLQGDPPKLARKENAADSLARKFLPKVAPSNFLTDGRFFFLGAGPFLKLRNDEDYEDGKARTFVDSHGKPEIRYAVDVNENTTLLLEAIRHLERPRMQVGFGPPGHSYDSGPLEINGIGSLIHSLAERVPAFFLTEKGMVSAGLISIKAKLADEYLGCVSNNPEVLFGTSSLPEGEILGIFIPYDRALRVSLKLTRAKNHWTADLNDDGIPELAGISETFSGISSDTMASLTWYANIDGVWTLIDAAVEPDCT